MMILPAADQVFGISFILRWPFLEKSIGSARVALGRGGEGGGRGEGRGRGEGTTQDSALPDRAEPASDVSR